MRTLFNMFLIVGIATLVTYSCNNGKSDKPPGWGTGNDTSYTMATYAYSVVGNDIRTGKAVRFSKDTIMPDPKDKTRNIPTRDTFNNIFLVEKVFDSLDNQVKNSAGRDSIIYRWQTVNKKAVIRDLYWDYRAVEQAEFDTFRKQQAQRMQKK